MIMKMKVIDLKGHLAALGQPISGLKAELQSRLREAVSRMPAAASTDGASQADSSQDEEWKVKRILARRVCTNLVDDVAHDVVEYQVQWD